MVKKLVSRAIEIYKREGVRSLMSGSKDFVSYRTPDIKPIYWNMRGEQTLSVGDTEATFGSSTDVGGDKVRKSYRTEKKFLYDVLEDLRHDDIFYDIGANLGLFGGFAAKEVPDGEVVAFEPYPLNTEQLRENLSKNGIDGNWTVVEAAVSNTTGTVGFSYTGDEVGMQRGYISSNGESVQVDCLSGDKLINDKGLPQPNVVKIDVEGAEPLVIEGMEKALSDESCRSVYCEIHLSWENGERPSVQHYGETADSLIREIKSYGFSIEYRKKRGRELHIKASKT